MKKFQKVYKDFFSILTLNDRYKGYSPNFDVFRKEVYNNPAVAMAWGKIKSAYQNLEFKTYKKVDGKLEPSNNEFVDRTLASPNELITGSQFQEYCLFYRMFAGMQLIQKADGITRSRLNVISPSQISEIVYKENELAIDYIQLNTTKIEGDDLENFFLNCPFDPATNVAGMTEGYTPYQALASLSDLTDFVLKHNIAFIKNSGNTPGMFIPKNEPNQRLSAKFLDELTEKVEKALNTYKNAGKIKVLPQEMNYIDTEKAPKDLDWTKGLELSLKMMGNIMGVPLPLIWDTNSTYNNVSEAKTQLYKETIIPIARSQSEYYTQIFADNLKDNEIVYFDLSNVEELKKDFKLVVETLKNSDFMTINEKREYFSNYTGYKLDEKTNEELNEIWISSSLNTTTQAVEEVVVEEGSGTDE